MCFEQTAFSIRRKGSRIPKMQVFRLISINAPREDSSLIKKDISILVNVVILAVDLFLLVKYTIIITRLA